PEPIEDPECYRPYVELPKDFEPGQGEVYDRLRDPEYDLSYLMDRFDNPFDVTCDAFKYLDDAQLFLDDYIGYTSEDEIPVSFKLDPDGDGKVNCPALEPIPYVRPATDEEAAEILGAVAVQETDEDGDASFNLPAGCYYAVIGGLGYETTVEEFCLEPGETEVNEVNLGIAPGALYKRFVSPTGSVIPICVSLDTGQYFDTQQSCEAAFESGDDVIPLADVIGVLLGFPFAVGLQATICKGTIDDADDCNSPSDAGVVYHGGQDDLIFNAGMDEYDLIYFYDLYVTLAPGTYTLCWEARYSYPTMLGFDNPQYGWAGPACETFDIASNEETRVLNWTGNYQSGTLDVFVSDSGGNALPNILVLLFDQDGELVDYTCTDSYGEAQFDHVPDGNYTVTATDSAPDYGFGGSCGTGDDFETQNAGVVYGTTLDYVNDGYVDDELDAWYLGSPVNGEPDVIIALSPEIV
ncbi:MAG: hypothetical protein DCC58_05805, partial [Chloroflexi bacterium]